jgi:hypothetical protein
MLSFEDWATDVDQIICRTQRTGRNLITAPYAEMYQANMSAQAAAYKVLYESPETDDPSPDWYNRRSELREDMVFETACYGRVKLDRQVPGDGTKWYVASWLNDHWSWEDGTIEPGDLLGEPQTA